MESKLKVTSRSAGAIRHAGGTFRSVGPDVIAKALSADEIITRPSARGAPISLYALRQELGARVRSTGGRPALEGATKIQKIPLKPEDWSRLEELAARLAQEGVSATAGQLASVIVHKQLELLGSSARGHARRPSHRVMKPTARSQRGRD
jgi:hypothetical protein